MSRRSNLFASVLLSLTASDLALSQAQFAALPHSLALGRMACAEKHIVTIAPSQTQPAHYDILIGKAHYVAAQIPTESGALKLEDKHHGIVWLQMSNKSMLFNEKIGKRLATDCQNDAQKAVQAAMDAPSATP